MPRLACWSCGRRVYATAPVEALWADERRCLTCGAQMNGDRRAVDRRVFGDRRQNTPHFPGPPGGEERRSGEDRRGSLQRRRPA